MKNNVKTKWILLVLVVFGTLQAWCAEVFVSFEAGDNLFPIALSGKPVPLLLDKEEDEGIRMASDNLRCDLLAVCGSKPDVVSSPVSRCVLVGSLQSQFVQRLVKTGKIEGKQLKGKREKFVIQTVKTPMAGVDEALVIAGSDKRGAIYGVYELSRQIGVSPWYWWMDVPIARHRDIYVMPGCFTNGEPKVEYRGIFINDEWPCFGEWAKEKFGSINSKVYQKVFELILRLNGNFLWPAMWGSAFYDDDPKNGELANTMGIVMGTSHHEPMALAQQDWKRKGKGAWDYTTNAKGLQAFWTAGMERAKDWETLVTIGMRGDGDEPMSENANIALLENIVRDQRRIIEKVTGKKAKETPQVWALYKEVQEYYDKGMKVPDDVTLLLCDDNWGNVRKLPRQGEKLRSGGYGMYYHFDYVGAPRNSKWININPIPRIWEQMNLAYQHGVRKLWVVNVGDLKPMEYPITFFLDMAWNPERFDAGNLHRHAEDFCRQAFGEKHAKEIARILRTYAKYNRRVTPEMLSAKTYSFNYGEWKRVRDEYQQLVADALKVRFLLPASSHDAYDQLIAFPVQACANLYDMYYAQAMNKKLSVDKDAEANAWADRVEACFEYDKELTDYYHKEIASGKWNHLMSQAHIGYTSWQQPDEQAMPIVSRVAGQDKTFVFEEKDGCVSMEAEHYTRCSNQQDGKWVVIPELGRTLSGMTTMPVTVVPDRMVLEYDMDVKSCGMAKVIARLSPTLNFHGKGLRYAIRIDDGDEQVVDVNGDYDGEIGEWQAAHLIETYTKHVIATPGRHTLKIRPLDAGLVFQKIMVDMGGLQDSFLGAPETQKR